jgi:simple sugar transport system ATP-binding protein
VADNILLGEETMANRVFLDRREAHRRIVELGRRFGFEIDPEAKVGSLSVGWQQRVEILKALYRNARILVLDEPTAVLTPQETDEIFAVLRRLAGEGHSIVFISHKLYEVLAIADRITVIRRGRVVGERRPAETNEDDLAELMVGREVQLTVDRGTSHPGATVLRVSGLEATSMCGLERFSGSPASPATVRMSSSSRSSGSGARRRGRSRSTAPT